MSCRDSVSIARGGAARARWRRWRVAGARARTTLRTREGDGVLKGRRMQGERTWFPGSSTWFPRSRSSLKGFGDILVSRTTGRLSLPVETRRRTIERRTRRTARTRLGADRRDALARRPRSGRRARDRARGGGRGLESASDGRSDARARRGARVRTSSAGYARI